MVPALTARLKVKEAKESGLFSKTFGRFGNACCAVSGVIIKSAQIWLGSWCLSLAAGGGAYILSQNIDNELLPSEDRGTIRILHEVQTVLA